MGRTFEEITPELAQWIAAQPVFFVATAPLATDGHVNCSPKGGRTLRVLGPREIAWLDYIGSGAETMAHLRENGRIVLLFCAFHGAPKIVRLHGRGEGLRAGSAEFEALAGRFESHPGARSIVRVAVDRISDSCGWGVPEMDLKAPRVLLADWAGKKGMRGLEDYMREKNSRSIDGLPSFDPR